MTNFLSMANATYQSVEKALSDAHTQFESGDYSSCEGTLSLSAILLESLERTLSKIPAVVVDDGDGEEAAPTTTEEESVQNV